VKSQVWGHWRRWGG